jgi:protease-4
MVAVGVALGLPRDARAQQPLPVAEPPTPGVLNPTVGVAGDGDASSVDKNPAALAFMPSWSGVYLHSELSSTGVVGGRGDGFFVASPLPYVDWLVLGAAVQLLRPPSTFPFPNENKFSLALGLRVGPRLSLGISYAHLWADRGPVAPGINTLDVAATFRPWRWVAAALVVHDLPSPAVDGLPLQRVWEPEVAVRPFGNQTLELAAGARFGERRGDVDPHFRLWATPTPGLTIKADLEWKRDVNLDGILENDLRFAIGVAVDFEHVGANVLALFGRDSGQVQGHGATVSLRISGDRYPAVWNGPRHLERVDLGSDVKGRKLAHVLMRLKKLERTPEVGGVVLVIGDLGGSWAGAEELRAALISLRRARKHVYSYISETSTRGYYVAAAAERVYQDPAGGIRLTGMSSTVTFFRGLGDLIAVRADFVKIAEYKSAPEAYTRGSSSAPARDQRQAMLDDIYAHVTAGLAEARHVSSDKVRGWIDRGPYTAVEALAAGLVDELRTGDDIQQAIGDRLGHRVDIDREPSSKARADDWLRPQIAVLFVEGDIVDGKSQTIPLLDLHLTGMQTLVPAIERARNDSRVQALVLRIDSPGGSALASDVIARELALTEQVKPVICSLGDVAASGGYFIAAPCARIFAAPSTLTGSIGIFSGKFDIAGLAAKLGISAEHYERGAHASIDSMWRPYTDEERQLILQKLRYFYGRFVDTVAKGRHLSPTEVDAVGRGHIWSGDAALGRGLVDEFGGLMDAVAEAKRRGGLREDAPVDLVALPEEQSLLGQLLGLLGIQLSAGAAAKLDVSPLIAPLLRGIPGSLLLEPSVPQARLDVVLNVE